VQTDVRLIAATNRDLLEMVETGSFRGDLYYRLSVFTIHLPPLRERGADVPLLANHFVRRFSRELGKDVQHLAPDVLDALQRHTWPGNVRELQSVLKQALLQATGPVLVADFLPAGLRTKHGETSRLTEEPAVPDLQRFIEGRMQSG